MTIRDFSRKYDVPYTIVRSASLKIRDGNTAEHEEKALFDAVVDQLTASAKYYGDLYEKDIQLLKNMESKRDFE